MRGADSSSRSAVIVLCLLGYDLWTTAAKTLQENSDAKGTRHAVYTLEYITPVYVYKDLDRDLEALF